MRMVLHGAILLVASAALAAPPEKPKELKTPPHFYFLPNQHENGALSMECEGKAPFADITCHFTQVAITRREPEPMPKEVEEKFLAMPWAEAKSERDIMCAGLGAQHGLPPKPGSAKAAMLEASRAAIRPVCGCTDNRCLLDAMKRAFSVGAPTCKVWTQTFDTVFRRVPGERKWVSDSSPQGLCNSVNVSVIALEPSDDSGLDYQWTYTQTRVTADTALKLCEGLEIGVPYVNSWRAQNTSLMNCGTIEFGL